MIVELALVVVVHNEHRRVNSVLSDVAAELDADLSTSYAMQGGTMGGTTTMFV